jgi:YidC/Oxa1 family membrane protein insertase
LLWIEIVYRPIFNVLIVFLDLFNGSFGWAIIALTLLVRGLLYKNSAAGNAMQSQMGDMQPKMQALQEKHKDDPAKLQAEMMKLMKSQGA